MELRFANSFSHTSPLCCRWSPDGLHLASASKYQLIIRDQDLHILHIFACTEVIEEIRWAPDSRSLLCVSFAKNTVEIFSLLDTQWRAAIEEDSLLPGLTAVRWAPDSKHLVIVSDFQLTVSVWSLDTLSEVQQVKHPKYSWPSVLCREGKSGADGGHREDDEEDDAGLRGLHFSHRGRYLAVAQREGCKDSISILDCVKQWTLVKRFAVETQDLGDFAWSIDDRSICVWEAPHMPYKVVLYPLGKTSGVDQQRKSLSAYKDQLSVKTVAWSPDTQYIAVGSYDQMVRVLNSRTWKVEMECKHSKSSMPAKDTTIYREMETWCDGNDRHAPAPKEEQRDSRYAIYGVNDDPVEIKSVRPDPQKPNPELGVGLLQWCHDGSYFFSRNDNMPHVLWVWDAVKRSLVAVLVQRHPIKSARWHPTRTLLALCTSKPVVYLWSPSSCLTCDLPQDTKLMVRDISWNPNGKSLLLIDRKGFSACYFPSEARQ